MLCEILSGIPFVKKVLRRSQSHLDPDEPTNGIADSSIEDDLRFTRRIYRLCIYIDYKKSLIIGLVGYDFI